MTTPETPEIEDVKRLTRQQLRIGSLKSRVLLILGVTIWLITCWSIATIVPASIGQFLLIASVLPVIIYGALELSFSAKNHQVFMQQFAQRYGLRFKSRVPADGYDGLVFRLADHVSIINHASGTINQTSVQFYNASAAFYQETLPNKLRIASTTMIRPFTIFELTAERPMPQLFLDSKHTSFGSHFGGLLHLNRRLRLKLEGDFNEHFTLYVPEQYEIEALQIFTPEVMAELIDSSRHYELEIVGNQIRLMVASHILDKAQLDSMYQHALRIEQLFNTAFTRFHYQPIGDFTTELVKAD